MLWWFLWIVNVWHCTHTRSSTLCTHARESHTIINSENGINGSLDETPWLLLKMKLSLRKDTLLLVCGVICHSKVFLKSEEKALVWLSWAKRSSLMSVCVNMRLWNVNSLSRLPGELRCDGHHLHLKCHPFSPVSFSSFIPFLHQCVFLLFPLFIFVFTPTHTERFPDYFLMA